MNKNIIKKLNTIPFRKRRLYSFSINKKTLRYEGSWLIDNQPLEDINLSYEDEKCLWSKVIS